MLNENKEKIIFITQLILSSKHLTGHDSCSCWAFMFVTLIAFD